MFLRLFCFVFVFRLLSIRTIDEKKRKRRFKARSGGCHIWKRLDQPEWEKSKSRIVVVVWKSLRGGGHYLVVLHAILVNINSITMQSLSYNNLNNRRMEWSRIILANFDCISCSSWLSEQITECKFRQDNVTGKKKRKDWFHVWYCAKKKFKILNLRATVPHEPASILLSILHSPVTRNIQIVVHPEP